MLAVSSCGLLNRALSFLLRGRLLVIQEHKTQMCTKQYNLDPLSANKIFMMNNILDAALINKIQIY